MASAAELKNRERGRHKGDPTSNGSADIAGLLEKAFGVGFALLDGATGDPISEAPGMPWSDLGLVSELCREVARRRSPEFVADEDPFLALAIPLAVDQGGVRVAVGLFLSRMPGTPSDFAAAARALGLKADAIGPWVANQKVWSPSALLQMAELVIGQWAAQNQIRQLETETRSLSDHLASTYEEISLLHRLTHNLKLSESDEDLGRVVLDWLVDVLPAEMLGIELLPVVKEDEAVCAPGRTESLLLCNGTRILDMPRLEKLMEQVGVKRAARPVVVNRPVTSQASWPFPEVRELIAVTLAEGENHFGWLFAVNHPDGAEFGTVEANLLSSVATILGIHSGNIELYRKQSELLAGVVRALTAAVDAKDPYTCGHSDRVARIAARLAREMGVPPKTVNMVYLSGLLHDIGKIGINDAVLHKPGKLTDVEYEHIKQHVEIGRRIVTDLKKLDGVLPVVRHHHESWDGTGYPLGLAGENIPLAARIVAVADAYDAMGSDRPYRSGMSHDKIYAVLQAGSGKQWDPNVVDAFFRVRDELREIVRRTDEPLTLDLSAIPQR